MSQKFYPDDSFPPGRGAIKMQIRDASQLFDALDPSPFHAKDLDHRAEEYIFENAKELPRRSSFSLIVLLDEPTGDAQDLVIGNAIRTHFQRRSQRLRRQLRQLLGHGLISLGIGLVFLASMFVITRVIAQLLVKSSLAMLFREGLLIVGWVAMWRPLEIFLYDWWPIVGEQRLADRLSEIPVKVILRNPGAPKEPATAQNPNEIRALSRWETDGGRVLKAEQWE